MEIKLNILPVDFDGPDITLPYLQINPGDKPRSVFPGLYDDSGAARLVYNEARAHIVFLHGIAPDGYNCGSNLYEWTGWHPLPLAMIEQSLADYFASTFEVAREFLGRHPWGFMVLRPVARLEFAHLLFQDGLFFRAVKLVDRPHYGLVIDWKAKTVFRTTLAEDIYSKIAVGASVVLSGKTADDVLKRYEGHFCGRVKSLNSDKATVMFPDGTDREIARSLLKLEPKPHNFALFDRAYPKLAPRGGISTARLQLDKTLSGNIRNRSIFKDRLSSALQFISQNGGENLIVPLSADSTRTVTFSLSPVRPGSRSESSIFAFSFPQPDFAFGSKPSPVKTRKKTEGMIKAGPFEKPLVPVPVCGFIFAESHRVDARKLYSALKEGIGYFGGTQKWFRMGIARDAVIHISGFDVEKSMSPAESALLYKKALEKWLASGPTRMPDIFFVVHDRTERDEGTSPYYICKSILLSRGIMTQNVTVDLIRNAQQFEWSAANIALGAFAKLGGVPWTVVPCSNRTSLILGIGRTEKHDPVSRNRKRLQAYATCISSIGRFGFVSIYPEVQEEAFIGSLKAAALCALGEAEKLDLPYDSIIVHLTGDLRRNEREAVEAAVKSYRPQNTPVVCVVSVSDRADYFAVTDQNPQGLPSRGQVVRIARNEYLLFTEGIEDLGASRFRTPSAVKIKVRYMPDGVDPVSLVAQVYDLAQVNFRAFNGTSRPISVLYSELIARAIQSGDFATALAQRPDLAGRMWFL